MKKYLILILMILVPVMAAAAFVLIQVLGPTQGLLWTPAALLLVVLIAGRLIWKHRRARENTYAEVIEHRPGSMHYQSLVHLDISADKLGHLCNQTLRLTTGRESAPSERDGEFTAVTPFNLRDWGQRVTLHAENRGTETVVRIESRPRFQLAPPDQGKNARHVHTCVEYLKRYERALAVGIE